MMNWWRCSVCDVSAFWDLRKGLRSKQKLNRKSTSSFWIILKYFNLFSNDNNNSVFICFNLKNKKIKWRKNWDIKIGTVVMGKFGSMGIVISEEKKGGYLYPRALLLIYCISPTQIRVLPKSFASISSKISISISNFWRTNHQKNYIYYYYYY